MLREVRCLHCAVGGRVYATRDRSSPLHHPQYEDAACYAMPSTELRYDAIPSTKVPHATE
eukprot:3941347-Rhodomonas_salina.3